MLEALHFALESTEYEFAGRQAIGLGLADTFDSLAVSFATVGWDISPVIVIRRELLEDESIDEAEVSVRHACSLLHLEALRDWYHDVPHEMAADGDDLWSRREELFPRLRFLPRTEPQLRGLLTGTPQLAAVNLRLWEIQSAVASWQTADEPMPVFRSKVTPEHEGRRRLCWFKNTAGTDCLFDLHARYTPGVGRIHMWCNREMQTAEIAHIGEKL